MLCCAAVALLRSLVDERVQPVTARLLVGRSPACGLRLTDPHASGEHATVTWTGWHWEIRDLGSRNGTYVDGARLDPGLAVKLAVGTRIAFGDPERPWALEDDEAPRLMAVHAVTGEVREADGDLLVLPSDEAPEVTVYPEATGGWQQEDADGQLQPVRDQTTLHTSAGAWHLQLPFVNEGTPLMQLRMSLETLSIKFAVSQDEERVEMTLVHRGVEVPLEPREHGYVLLTLARARTGDTHLPPEQRGWRDREELERMLAMDANAMNVAIHRARQQLSKAGVSNAAGIVEVRRKQRRLGTDRFQLTKL
jgi:hypothetical protein